jgi:general secretion pathway protein D
MINWRKTLSFAVPCVVATALLASSVVGVTAEEKTRRSTNDDGNFTIHFESVELPVFVKFIGRATGRNFVFSERVGGTVTIISPNPVTADEAFAVFQSVLAVRGLTMIDDGIVTRIVPLKEARTAGSGVINDDPQHTGFATRLLPLEHVAATDVSRVLEPLVSKEGALVAYSATNTIIATDTVSNLNRMSGIVDALDVPGNQESIAVIELQHAEAQTIAGHISTVHTQTPTRAISNTKDRSAPTASPKGGPFRVIADTRTNSLIVTAGAIEMRKIRALAQKLDQPLKPGDERIHVYYVRYADAEDLVTVIEQTLNIRRRPQGKSAESGSRSATNQAAAMSSLGSNISVSADAATNAIIIAASNQDYQTLLTLLESLDIPRPQVFVEAIVAEVSLSRARELGIEMQGSFDTGDGTVVLRSSLSGVGAAFASGGLAGLAGLGGAVGAAISDKGLDVDGVEIPAQAAVLRALAEDADVEILSAPTLLTLDNQEAEILVGQNVPFITGQGVDRGSVDNVFTSVDRRDVGIKLKIKPQVSEGNHVILQIEEEVSALIPNALLDENQVGPTLTIRSAKTTVSVADGQTVVIGGLISDALSKRESKVPILGDIPYIGRLFRVDSKSREKVNLLVILTPHIIRSTEDLQIVSERKRERFDAGNPPADLDLPQVSSHTNPPPRVAREDARGTSPGADPDREADPDTGARYILPADDTDNGS